MHKAKPKQANCLLGLHPTSTHSGYGGYCLAVVALPLSRCQATHFPLAFWCPPLAKPLLAYNDINVKYYFYPLFDFLTKCAHSRRIPTNAYFTSRRIHHFPCPSMSFQTKRKNRVDGSLQIFRMASWKAQIILPW